jgi:hypothetical protein
VQFSGCYNKYMSELDLTNIAAASIGTPDTGVLAVYSESTTPAKRLSSKNDAGTVINYAGLDTADTLTNKVIVLTAGSASVEPLTLTSGPVKTVTVAGGNEYDGNVFYSTPVSGARGLSPSTMFAIVPSGDFSLSTTSGVQSAFPAANDVWTLAATTSYLFEGIYLITHTTTTCTCAMAFALAGGASVTAINYYVDASILAVNVTSTASNATWVGQVASTVVTATSTVGWAIQFRGIIQMNAGGTVTPQVAWSANTTAPVMKANSYIMFTPLGTNTVSALGNVG